MFQGQNSNANDLDNEEDEEPESNQNLLSSINSQAENNSTPPSNQTNNQQQVVNTVEQPASSHLRGSEEWTTTENHPSQLAAIEDVLRLTPHNNTLEGLGSLASVDSSD